MTLEGMIIHLLDGINGMDSESQKGWWETSTGAKFGEEKLKTLLALIENPQVILLQLRLLQKGMTDNERTELWNALMEDYCKDCGQKDHNRSCQCWNDE